MANPLRNIKQASVPVGVLVIGIVIAGWFFASRPRALPKPPEEKIWPVSVVIATPVDVHPEISAFGEIRAAREAEIRAMVAGRLVSLNPQFKNGSLLAAGTELATIDPVDYQNNLAEQRAEHARAAAQVAEYERELQWESRLQENAQQQVEIARRALDRTTQLQRDGRESKKALDDAEAALASAEQNALQRAQAVGRLRSRIAQQQAAFEKAQATLAMAERDLARTRVVAPFDGYVTDVRLALGKLLAVGETLGRLLSATELEARFDLAEADYARLLLGVADGSADAAALLGREVTVVWRLGDTERRFRAHLLRIGAEIDPTLGGIKMFAGVDSEAQKHGLRAGAFVEIRVPDRVYREVYRLPARALSDNDTIYVIRDGRLVPIAVRIERKLDDDVLVRGEFNDGEMVVARAFAGIGPGLRARAL
jgi:multidrug efflux system membrane fusion protein